MHPRSRLATATTVVALLAGCGSSSPPGPALTDEAPTSAGDELPEAPAVAPLPGPTLTATAVPQRLFAGEITPEQVPGQPPGVRMGVGFEGYLAFADGDGRVRWARRLYVTEMDTRDAVTDGRVVGITPDLATVLVAVGYGDGAADAEAMFVDLDAPGDVRGAATQDAVLAITGTRDLRTVALLVRGEDLDARFELRDVHGVIRCSFPAGEAYESAFTADGRYIFVGGDTEWSDVRSTVNCEAVEPWPAEDPSVQDPSGASAESVIGLVADEAADPLQISNLAFVDVGIRLRARYRSYIVSSGGATAQFNENDLLDDAPHARAALSGLRLLAQDEVARIAVGLEDCDDCDVPRLIPVDLRTGRRGRPIVMTDDLTEEEYDEDARATFAFSPDGRYAIAYLASGGKILIDVRRGRVTRRFPDDEWVRFADSRHLLTGKDRAIRLVSTSGGRGTLLEAHADLVDVSQGLVLTSTTEGDERDFVLRRIVGGERVTTRARRAGFDARGHAFLHRAEGFERIDPATFERTSYPGHRVASLGESVVYCSAGTMRLRVGGAEPRDLGPCPAPRADVALRPDGKSIAVWSEGVLRVLRTDDGTRVDVAMLASSTGVTAVAFDDEGASALVAGEADDFLIRERGPLFTAALRPVGHDEALLRRLAHVLEP